ncbi:MAG TPA: FAD:protein FMN transferase [Woeseiaceae bacterium]|nr:FAD:protein FMN transferase [Woeseiaceae bacterium]
MTSQYTSGVLQRSGKDTSRPSPTLASTAGRLAIVLVTPLALAGPAGAEWISGERPMMGTEVRVQLWHEDRPSGTRAVQAVFAEFERIDALMSTFREDSRISIINREAAERAVPAGAELFDLIVRSLDMSVLTRGAFDITFDSVGQHYDFRAERRPDADTTAQELPLIDYRLVQTNAAERSVRFVEPGVRINLGGIAKGYAVERGAGILLDSGIRHAIVTAGGDSRLVGDRRGSPWVVGIRDPRKDGEVAVRIPLENEALSTSGDYERYFFENGKRYHHIIEPSTGEPAGSVRSVTIVGPDAVITDALSTAVFVMGVDRGLRLIATLPDYEGVVIDAEGRLYYSDGLRPPEP